MANRNVLVNETSLENIADAIREKLSETDTYKPREMAPAIRRIPTGEPQWVDPEIYYEDTRPADWPAVPLPAALEDPESEFYAGGKACTYQMYERPAGAAFVTDRFVLQGTNIAAEVQKYLGTTPVGSPEAITPTVSGSDVIVNFEYTDADADWNDWNRLTLKLTADTLTSFDYTRQRWVNGYPLPVGSATSLTEITGTAPGLQTIKLSGTNMRYASSLEYFSLGLNAVTSLNNLFLNCYNLLAVPEMNTSSATSMEYMFQNCYRMKTIPVMDTSNVTNMRGMFRGCIDMEAPPPINTSAATTMREMFAQCYSLQTAPLYDTTNVTSMENMFSGCDGLHTVPLFDTRNVTTMGSMFYSCTALSSVPLFDTRNVTNMSSMFLGCWCLQTVPLFDTSNVTNMGSMFNSCKSLRTVPLFDTSKVTNMNKMFFSCDSLESVPLFDTSSVTNMSEMFNACPTLQTVPLFDTSKVTNMGTMFTNCYSLQAVPAIDTGAVTRFSSTFSNCASLQKLPQLNTSSATVRTGMFNNTLALKTIDLSYWHVTTTSQITDMFYDAKGLTKLIIRSFGTGRVLTSNALGRCYHFTGYVDAQYNPTGAKDGYIYVPDELVDTIKTTANWSTYASQIKGLSEL